MSVVITRDDIIAYAEVDYIIHHMNVRYLEMLPNKLVKFFGEMKDPNCEVFVDPKIPLQNQGLKRYTLEIIALLHLKYWCEDEERKKELYARMEYNQVKLAEHLKEKYNTDNIFNNDDEEKEEPREDLSKPKKLNLVGNKKEEKNENKSNVDTSALQNNGDQKDSENNNESNMIKKEEKSILNSILAIFKKMFSKEKNKA